MNGDAGEEYALELEAEKRKNYPALSDILHMCRALNVNWNSRRGLDEQDAWAYYHELKAQLESQHRKTA